MSIHPNPPLGCRFDYNIGRVPNIGGFVLALTCYALGVFIWCDANAQRLRPSRPSAVPSQFESIQWLPLYRTGLRYTNSPDDPLDLPTVACLVEQHWTRPGNGAGNRGVTFSLPTIDTGCGGDIARFYFAPIFPVPEFNGESGAGPWMTMGTCDTMQVTVTLLQDLPGVSGRLWGTREFVKCWQGFELREASVGRRRVTR